MNTPWLDTLGQMSSAKDALDMLLNRYRLPAFSSLRSPAVIGASRIGVDICNVLIANDRHPVGLYDENPALENVGMAGQRVMPLEAIHEIDKDIPVILATHRLLKLQDFLAETGFANVWPFPVLSFAYPSVFPQHNFYERLPEQVFAGQQEIKRTAALLADPVSLEVLDAVIGFRLTLDSTIFAGMLADSAYMPEDVVHLRDNEVFIDAGAFDGDTVSRFIDRTSGRFNRIIAFEPGTAPFSRLSERFADDKRITAKNMCVAADNGTIGFDDTGTRDSAITEAGTTCECTAIDNLPENMSVTFIKANVEGAELLLLEGARRTAGRQAPTFAVAAYHRPAHLWKIPLFLLELNPGYKLFMRQHDAGIIETVVYATLR